MTQRPAIPEAVKRAPGDDDLIVVPTCCGLCVVIDRRDIEEAARDRATCDPSRGAADARAFFFERAVSWVSRQFAAVRAAS